MVVVAVIPGLSFRSGFAASITTSYVTTFDVVVDCSRTCRTVPWKVSSV